MYKHIYLGETLGNRTFRLLACCDSEAQSLCLKNLPNVPFVLFSPISVPNRCPLKTPLSCCVLCSSVELTQCNIQCRGAVPAAFSYLISNPGSALCWSVLAPASHHHGIGCNYFFLVYVRELLVKQRKGGLTEQNAALFSTFLMFFLSRRRQMWREHYLFTQGEDTTFWQIQVKSVDVEKLPGWNAWDGARLNKIKCSPLIKSEKKVKLPKANVGDKTLWRRHDLVFW